ncbi:MAG: hypothetical protein ACR2NB_14305 [Solirubrobacteraceae bacterium]
MDRQAQGRDHLRRLLVGDVDDARGADLRAVGGGDDRARAAGELVDLDGIAFPLIVTGIATWGIVRRFQVRAAICGARGFGLRAWTSERSTICRPSEPAT